MGGFGHGFCTQFDIRVGSCLLFANALLNFVADDYPQGGSGRIESKYMFVVTDVVGSGRHRLSVDRLRSEKYESTRNYDLPTIFPVTSLTDEIDSQMKSDTCRRRLKMIEPIYLYSCSFALLSSIDSSFVQYINALPG